MADTSTTSAAPESTPATAIKTLELKVRKLDKLETTRTRELGGT
jgi:hypothetical protein